MSRRHLPSRSRVRAPLQPVQRLAVPPHAERVACVPEAHELQGCAACLAWEHGYVLLVDGTTVGKVLWMHALEPKHEHEEEDGRHA